MRIGLVLPYNVARGGGVQTLVFTYQAELRRRGHDAIVITPAPRDKTIDADGFGNTIFVGNGTDVRSPLHTTPQLSAGYYAQWTGTAIYNTGQRVLFNGVPYQAKWWNQGQSPAAATSDPGNSPWAPLTQAQINALLAQVK